MRACHSGPCAPLAERAAHRLDTAPPDSIVNAPVRSLTVTRGYPAPQVSHVTGRTAYCSAWWRGSWRSWPTCRRVSRPPPGREAALRRWGLPECSQAVLVSRQPAAQVHASVPDAAHSLSRLGASSRASIVGSSISSRNTWVKRSASPSSFAAPPQTYSVAGGRIPTNLGPSAEGWTRTVMIFLLIVVVAGIVAMWNRSRYRP